MQVNQNYGAVTAESLAKSQAFWAKVREELNAQAAARAAAKREG